MRRHAVAMRLVTLRKIGGIAAAMWLGSGGDPPAFAQEVAGPPVPPIVQPRQCQPSEPGADEVVVCGRREGDDSPFRIPRQLRDQGQAELEDEHVSWDTQVRNMESLERFSNQNTPGGMSQHSRQVDCEWRAARQAAAGRRPDCGRGRRSGE